MSSFICKKCEALCLDSPLGYISGCKHHPPELTRLSTIERDIIDYARSRGAYIPIPPQYEEENEKRTQND